MGQAFCTEVMLASCLSVTKEQGRGGLLPRGSVYQCNWVLQIEINGNFLWMSICVAVKGINQLKVHTIFEVKEK